MKIDKLFIYKIGNSQYFSNKLIDKNNYYTFHYVIYDLDNENEEEYHKIYIKNNINNECIITKGGPSIFGYDYLIYTPKKYNNNFIPINILKYKPNENYKLEKLHGHNNWIIFDTIYIYKDYLVDQDIIIHKNNIMNDNPYISIVMVHYNRLKQLEFTLNIINKSVYKNIEIIIVDDSSDTNFVNLLKNIINNYNIKIIFVEIKKNYKIYKSYKNPVIPFNIGFNLIKGKITIIQNSECCYNKDLINYVNENIKENLYIVFSCFSLSSVNTLQLHNLNTDDYFNFINNQVINIQKRNFWFAHATYADKKYHFTSALFTNKLIEIGGFHEGLFNDIAYDDDELLYRVRYNNIECKLIPFDQNNPFVIHQYHDIVYNNIGNGKYNQEIYSSILALNKNINYNLYKYL